MPIDEKLSLLNTVTIGKTQGNRIGREIGDDRSVSRNHFQIFQKGTCCILNSIAF